MGLTASEVFGAGVWIELRFSPRHCWYHSSILLLLIPPFIAPMNIHTGNEGSLEMILWLIQAPAWFFQNIWPQKLLNLLVSWVYRDQMVWSRMWGDLSSWLVPDLICITTVIHWDQNENFFFTLGICALSHSINRLCFFPPLPFSFDLSFLPCLPASFFSSICHFHLPTFITPLSIFIAILCPPTLPSLFPLSISAPSLSFLSIFHLASPLTPSPLLLLHPRL